MGQVVCDLASAEWPGGASTAQYLEVAIPVSVRLGQPKRSDLVVRAELRAPLGRRAAVGFVPSPTTAYDDASTTIHAGIDFAPFGGSVDSTSRRQRLVCDVTGVGTSRLEWSILGEDRPLAGNYEFRLRVRQEDAVFGWVEVTAELHAGRALPGFSLKPVSGQACAPLVADSSPQAAMTLILHDADDLEAKRTFVGRPLDLAFSTSPGGLAVGHARPDAEVIGSIRWFDSVEGRPGYQWVQKSPTLASLGTAPGQEIPQGKTEFLDDDCILHLPTGHRLRVAYDGEYAAGPATVKDALDIQVVVDEVTVAEYTTESTYLAVGRSRKDISIDRPDVSREHGCLELSGSGWSYTHQSRTHDAALLRADNPEVPIRAGSTVGVDHGDTLRFNDHVSLVIK